MAWELHRAVFAVAERENGGFLGCLSLPRSPAEGTRAPRISPVHLFLVIDGLISSWCERKQISSNLQQ